LSDTAGILAHPDIGAISVAKENADRTQVVYRLRGTPASTAKRLRALAAAIERGGDLDLGGVTRSNEDATVSHSPDHYAAQGLTNGR
jgi:hypothetical protein